MANAMASSTPTRLIPTQYSDVSHPPPVKADTRNDQKAQPCQRGDVLHCRSPHNV